MGEVNSYRDLRVWQVATDIAAGCYVLTQDLPKSETHGLCQIRRAAASAPANIAEGYGRDSSGNFVSLLRVAQGSLKELETHLLLSARVGIELLGQCEELGKMLRAFIRSIQRSAEAT